MVEYNPVEPSKRVQNNFNRAKYNNSESSWNLYHKKLCLYKKEIRISKRRARANFCSSIESAAEASRHSRILAKSPATIGYLKTNANWLPQTSQETLELLFDTHFPNTQAVEDLFIEENLDDQNIDNISKPDRIKWAINSFKLIGILAHIRLTINPSLLSDAQHAYRKGRSTNTALHSLLFRIERGFRNTE